MVPGRAHALDRAWLSRYGSAWHGDRAVRAACSRMALEPNPTLCCRTWRDLAGRVARWAALRTVLDLGLWGQSVGEDCAFGETAPRGWGPASLLCARRGGVVRGRSDVWDCPGSVLYVPRRWALLRCAVGIDWVDFGCCLGSVPACLWTREVYGPPKMLNVKCCVRQPPGVGLSPLSPFTFADVICVAACLGL